jgi:hypothetical protein
MTHRALSLFLATAAAVTLIQPAWAQTGIQRSVIAPRLPVPSFDENADPRTFLAVARQAVQRGRLGEAEEALERAETRLLDRQVVPAAADLPDNQRAILDIGTARRDLAARDRNGTIAAIDDALAVLQVSPSAPPASDQADRGPPPAPPGPIILVPPPNETPPSIPPPAAVPVPPVALPPTVTYALLPGHWQLEGAHYVWIPPETIPRLVQARPLVPGRNVWRDGRWVWVPAHYGPADRS